jgi:hypothetical protein
MDQKNTKPFKWKSGCLLPSFESSFLARARFAPTLFAFVCLFPGGASPPDPPWLASLGPSYADLLLVALFAHSFTADSVRFKWCSSSCESTLLGRPGLHFLQKLPYGALWTGPKDLLVGHRTSWWILPQTPVFSLCSAICRG